MENPKTHAYRSMIIDKMLDNSTYQNESHNIYVYTAHMSYNAESPRRYFVDIPQLTNWIFDSGATCHMTPEISDFILGSLVETDKYIEVEDDSLFTSNQTGEVQIKMRYDNGKPFIAMLYKVLFASELSDQLFSIIALINSGHNCLFNKGFFVELFSDN